MKASQPLVWLGLDAGFQMPVSRAVGFLDLFLREMKRLNSAPGNA